MQIEKIAVAKLKAAEYNPRKALKPGDAEYEKCWASLCERYDSIKRYQQDILEQTGQITGFPVPE